MITLLWIIGMVAAYVFAAGLLKRPMSKYALSHCSDCHDGKHHWVEEVRYSNVTKSMDSIVYHNDTGAVMAGFWPFTLPWTAGSLVAGIDPGKRKKVKSDSRRAEEIAEAMHQAELAQIRAEEDAHLTKQLQDK